MLPAWDPGLPAWADALLIAASLGLTALVAWLGTRGARRSSEAARREAQAAASTARAIEHEVKPNTGRSLADAVARIEADGRRTRDAFAALHESQARLEREIAEMGRDIGGIRSEMRHEREERHAVADRLDTHLTDVPRLIAEARRPTHATHDTQEES